MTWTAQIAIPVGQLPSWHALLDHIESVLDTEVRADEGCERLAAMDETGVSWLPWPTKSFELYVPGVSTRGMRVSAELRGTIIEVEVAQRSLATWSDWQLAVECACALGEFAGAPVRVDGRSEHSSDELRTRFLDDDDRYLDECREGAKGLGHLIQASGSNVHLEGPAGCAVIGQRTWARLQRVAMDDDDLAARLIDAALSSIEARGFEDLHQANPMEFRGASGQSVVALVLSPEQPTLLRNADFVLISPDIEGSPGTTMYLLPIESLDAAFPGSTTWLDDRCCALAALPRERWTERFARIRPLLLPLDEVLSSEPAKTGH
ncbi:MAG: hypothetical protein CL928_10230 [Deltaproteobacteria bacterium]|nr:hypothetical protein [Deltaproteobacteria bacterium]